MSPFVFGSSVSSSKCNSTLEDLCVVKNMYTIMMMITISIKIIIMAMRTTAIKVIITSTIIKVMIMMTILKTTIIKEEYWQPEVIMMTVIIRSGG